MVPVLPSALVPVGLLSPPSLTRSPDRTCLLVVLEAPFLGRVKLAAAVNTRAAASNTRAAAVKKPAAAVNKSAAAENNRSASVNQSAASVK